MAARKPASTGNGMKRATKPRRNRPRSQATSPLAAVVRMISAATVAKLRSDAGSGMRAAMPVAASDSRIAGVSCGWQRRRGS